MAAPLKVLTISHSYVVEANRRLAHELAVVGAGKWEITAVAPKWFPNSNDQQVIALESTTSAPYSLISHFPRFARSPHLFHLRRGIGETINCSWDIIHAWEEPYVFAGAQIARYAPRQSTLVYATFQNISKRYPPPFCWLEQYSMQRAAGWIAFGESVHESLANRPIYNARPFDVIPPGVDIVQYRPDRPAGKRLLEALGWQESGAAVIGMLGRLVPQKGIADLLAALRGIAAEWRLLIVGDGPMRSEILQFQKAYPAQVRLCGVVRHQDVPTYLNAMDILVAPSVTTPSWREQFGRMIIEAMACGVPVIGSDSGEIPHVIADAGFVVPEGDHALLRDALSSLLNDPRRRQAFAEVARARAVREFAWEVVAARTLAFFERLRDERRAGAR